MRPTFCLLDIGSVQDSGLPHPVKAKKAKGGAVRRRIISVQRQKLTENNKHLRTLKATSLWYISVHLSSNVLEVAVSCVVMVFIFIRFMRGNVWLHRLTILWGVYRVSSGGFLAVLSIACSKNVQGSSDIVNSKLSYEVAAKGGLRFSQAVHKIAFAFRSEVRRG